MAGKHPRRPRRLPRGRRCRAPGLGHGRATGTARRRLDRAVRRTRNCHRTFLHRRLMNAWSADRAATELLEAQDTHAPRGPLTDEWPDLDLRTAYAIQDATLCPRVERGEQVVGVKLGLTSRAKQQRMGISSPLVACLTDAMTLPAQAPIP